MAKVTTEQLKQGLDELTRQMPHVQANAMYEAGVKVGQAMGQKALLEQLVKADETKAAALKHMEQAEAEAEGDPEGETPVWKLAEQGEPDDGADAGQGQ